MWLAGPELPRDPRRPWPCLADRVIRRSSMSHLALTTSALALLTLVLPVDTPAVAALSPDGQVRIELALGRHGDVEAVPHYRVFFRGRAVVLTSRLGLDLADGPPLGGPCVVESVQAHSRHQTYTQVPGKRRRLHDHGSEAVVALRERTPPGRRWEVLLRAYDDGAALRYRLPKQDGWDALAVAGERTEFALPPDARAFALPLNGFTTSHEQRYQTR